MDSYGFFLMKQQLKKCYRYPRYVKRDIESTMQSFPSVQPTVVTFVFNHGQAEDLVCVYGMLPLSYNEGKSTYNMPIKIFLREDFPCKAPMVFLITPIPGMHFWIPKHLNFDGKIQIDYLTNWGKREGVIEMLFKPTETVLSLIQNLRAVLGEQLSVKKKQVDEAYRCLFLKSDASEDKVSATIRDLIRIYHPDKGGSHEYYIRLQFYISLIKEARSYPNW